MWGLASEVNEMVYVLCNRNEEAEAEIEAALFATAVATGELVLVIAKLEALPSVSQAFWNPSTEECCVASHRHGASQESGRGHHELHDADLYQVSSEHEVAVQHDQPDTSTTKR